MHQFVLVILNNYPVQLTCIIQLFDSVEPLIKFPPGKEYIHISPKVYYILYGAQTFSSFVKPPYKGHGGSTVYIGYQLGCLSKTALILL